MNCRGTKQLRQLFFYNSFFCHDHAVTQISDPPHAERQKAQQKLAGEDAYTALIQSVNADDTEKNR